MTPAAHSTQRRYRPEATEDALRDKERRAALFRKLGFLLAHIAATVQAGGELQPTGAWRAYFRNRFNRGVSAARLSDEKLADYVWTVESCASQEMGVTFPERKDAACQS